MRRTLWLLGLLTMLPLGAAIQEKVTLRAKVEPGQRSRLRVVSTLHLESAGRPRKMVSEIVFLHRIVEVYPDGNFKREQTIESYEITIDGRKIPTPETLRQDKSVLILSPTYALVRRDSSGETSVSFAEERHVSQAGTLVFPDKPVGVGDQWRFTTKDDPDLGTAPAVFQYTLRGFETWQGIRVARVRAVYTARDDTKITARGDHLVDIEKGRVVYCKVKVENIKFRQSDGSIVTAAELEWERLD